ncbi:MAG: hypothetical protein KDD44_10455 [Bdellovibrionales bacterium]|nr:hypothetical protein [Bdellovibrionales bacterium]
MADSENEIEFKPGDRVARAGEASGPFGTVQSIRVETVRNSIKKEGGEAAGVTITVLWDNGTLSHFVPSGLEVQ